MTCYPPFKNSNYPQFKNSNELSFFRYFKHLSLKTNKTNYIKISYIIQSFVIDN